MKNTLYMMILCATLLGCSSKEETNIEPFATVLVRGLTNLYVFACEDAHFWNGSVLGTGCYDTFAPPGGRYRIDKINVTNVAIEKVEKFNPIYS